jgi:hypothetical protein
MPRHEPGMLQTMWDCRWSRPTTDLVGTPQQAARWVCVRRPYIRRAITETDCDTCSHWQADVPAAAERERKPRRLRVQRSHRLLIHRDE